MEEIQNKAIATYQKNLEFLSNYDRKLYDRLQGLSTIIDMGEYVPRYHIEYISEDESFDIFDEVSNSYLYQKQASQFDKTAVSNTNKDKINSFDLFNPDFYNTPHKMKLDGNMPDKLQYAIKVSNDISEYTKIFKYSTKDPKKQFKKIDKFVFMGTLLGTHIPKIHKKLQSDCYFITDANLEIFRLSLFATDYSEIAQKSKLIFSIMDDKSVFLNKFDSYLNYSMKSNYMVKYYSTNFNMQDYFDRALEAIFLKSPFKFSYVKYIEQVLTCSLTNMKKYPAVLNAKSHNFLENKPVLCVAAGPTFGKNIDWIKKNHKKYFLVAIGATVKKLIENDIFPDLITSADPGEHTVDHFPKKILDKIKDIPFLTSHMTHDNVLNCFNKKNIYLYEAMTSIKETSRLIEGASIGEATLDLLLSFGANQIYLLGSDLALDQETGRTHEADYEYGKQLDVNPSEVKENQFMEDGKVDIKDTIIKVKGNFRESVSTTAVFARSILAYNVIVYKFLSKNPSIKIYNLNDGAYIEGTITEKIDNIDIPKEDSSLDAKEFLDKNSSTRFPLNDIERMKKSIPFVCEIIEIINKIEVNKSKTYDAFLNQRTELIAFIINNAKNFKGLNISEIFGLYISTIEPYLGYNFNDTKKIDEANLVKKVKKVWCRQVKGLANKYIEILNSTIFSEIKYEKIEVNATDDFELGIKRSSKLTYHIAYNVNASPQGVVFIVPGFGEDANLDYQKNILKSIVEKYNAVGVFVEYHGIYSRIQNGATINLDEKDKTRINDILEKYNLPQSLLNENIYTLIDKLNSKIEALKDSGDLEVDYKENIVATLSPKKDEYQNFGLLQAVDILTVLCDLASNKIFEKVVDQKPLILLGSSHGAYIANLAVKIAPDVFTAVIDNSSYVKPQMRYIAGKELDLNRPEVKMETDLNIVLNLFTKTHWNFDENTTGYFSKSAYEIRDLTNEEHIQKYGRYTEYISYHSVFDKVASFKEKEEFYKKLNEYKIKANLIKVDNIEQVDGIFIKSLDHAMDISIKELMHKHVPNILPFLEPVNRIKLLKDSEVLYETADGVYSFKFRDFNFYPTFKLEKKGE